MIYTMSFIVPTMVFVGCWMCLTVNVPYWDDYDVFIRYLSEPWPDRWEHLFDFHNEHRIVTTRLIADAIVALNGGTFNFRAMMGVGNAIQLAYAFMWIWAFKKSRYGIMAALPAFWLLTAFIHYENTCWALCAVQNVIVVALTFASCILFSFRKQNRIALAGSMLCGIAATFSSGSGLIVWPCIIAMELSQPLSESGAWGKGIRNIRQHIKSSIRRILPVFLIATIAIYAYFNDFPCNEVEQTSDIHAKLINGLFFFTAFLGGILPMYPAALVLGTILLPLIAFITIRYPRIRRPGIYWFMVAEILTMLAAATFRSSDPHAAVSSRYCIVSCSAFASIIYLSLEQFPLSTRTAKICVILLTGVIILYTTAFLIIGAPLFAKRNELMRHNILTWPAHIGGLRSASPESDSIYLFKCVNRGIYNPSAVLSPDETPPEKPLPWLH